jgi:GTPase SAR1 family protein
MSVMAGFAILITEAVVSFYKRVHAINFGVYGSTMVGKTTLSHQLRTRGEVPQINKRTVGLERATRKVIKFDGDSHTLKSSDIGGEAIYWKEWVKDMKNRKVKYIIFMIDHRHLDSPSNLDHQLAWKFLVDTIMSNTWPNGKKKKEVDYPMAVSIWANKYDIWGEKYPLREGQQIDKHDIYEPFKYGMRQLNDKGIPTFKYIVSAKSDPEMVYKGITTLIKDY